MDNTVKLETKYTLTFGKDFLVDELVSKHTTLRDLEYCTTHLTIGKGNSLVITITKDF